MKKFFRDFESLFGDDGFFKECIEYAVKKSSEELYKAILNFSFQEKLSDDFISLVYETLKAWNMNSRGAKLAEFNDFSKSVIDAYDEIKKLHKYTIKDFANNPDIFNTFEILFAELHLTQTKTKLVTFSKTMHFFFPPLLFLLIERIRWISFMGKHTLQGTNSNVLRIFTQVFLNL